jgi:two-component system cell cycle response regulator CpdR
MDSNQLAGVGIRVCMGRIWGGEPVRKLAKPMASIKILLAEDDTDMRRFLVKALQTAGYTVISYDNGLSAYERLREEPFELLLTDIVMPEMDGIELARRAAELDPDMKIMFITGFAAVALNPDSTAPRQAKVLSKPFHLRELVNEVGKMLAAARPAGSASAPPAELEK